MEVPSIEELTAAFGSEPVSVAETSYGHFLPLDQWPAGEISAGREVAGRTVTVLLAPSKSEVTIELGVPDDFAKVTVRHTQRVDIRSGNGIVDLVVMRLDGNDDAVVRLRLQPDIRLIVAVRG